VYLAERQCDRALKVFERAERAGVAAPDANHTAVWALALECGGDPAGALEKMKASVALEADVHTYAALGRMYISAGKLAEAEHALAKAELLNPSWELTYLYRARLKLARSDYPGASAELRRVLSLNPMNPQARHLLEQTGERSRSIL
jgi:tetratricopeptide (TPR) repeat protein